MRGREVREEEKGEKEKRGRKRINSNGMREWREERREERSREVKRK